MNTMNGYLLVVLDSKASESTTDSGFTYTQEDSKDEALTGTVVHGSLDAGTTVFFPRGEYPTIQRLEGKYLAVKEDQLIAFLP